MSVNYLCTKNDLLEPENSFPLVQQAYTVTLYWDYTEEGYITFMIKQNFKGALGLGF